MNEVLELCCTKMQKAIRKQWIKIYPYPRTNILAFMIDSIALIYCPFCGEYLPETSVRQCDNVVAFNAITAP